MVLQRDAVSLDGRIAVVTGGGAGIGAAIAAAFTEFGARVAVWDKDGAAATRTGSKIGGLACVIDVRDPDQVDAALANTIETLGPPSILVTTPAESSFLAFSILLRTAGTR